MPLVLAAPLPDFAPPTEERLSRLCARWERRMAPRLSPRQLVYCRRFGAGGKALKARASRLLARLLALRALPGFCTLDMEGTDGKGRPCVAGAPGWHVAFSHSGRAAFCLVLTPGETGGRPPGWAALDAETAGALPATDRAFVVPAPSPRAALRRWVLAETLFKALGAPPGAWAAAARGAHCGASRVAGSWRGARTPLSWRFLSAPGHALCVALPGDAPFSPGLRWLAWQSCL